MVSKFRRARDKLDLSITDLAKKSGVSRQTITSLEKGNGGNPTADTQTKLATALECEPGDLFEGIGKGEQRWSFRTRRIHLRNCEKLVEAVGEKLATHTEEIRDKEIGAHGHQSSSLDEYAARTMTAELNRIYNLSPLVEWSMWLEFEDVRAFASADGAMASAGDAVHAPVAYIDEIDGTTNAKRAGAGHLPFSLPKSAVTIALKHDSNSTVLEVGAVYAMDTRQVFSGLWSEGGYAAFFDRQLIEVGGCDQQRGDSKTRIIVPCYSNEHYAASAETMTAIDHALLKDDGSKGSECYGGSRSSTMDIIDILRNLYDGYVDLRADWTTDEEMAHDNAVLRLYDIAAVVPIAKGAGLAVVFSDGNDFSLKKMPSDAPIGIIIGRPAVVEKILAETTPIVGKFREKAASRNVR